MSFKNLKTSTKITFGVMMPLLMFFVVGYIVLEKEEAQQETSKWVSHTNKVLSKKDALVAAAVDMETGMRGYLLSGKEEFLDPYNSGNTDVFALIDELQTTVSDNPRQVGRLEEIKTLITDWKSNVTEPTIALRRKIGDANTMNDMADLVSEARGKTFFDKFRGDIATFIEREEKLLTERVNRFDADLASGSYDLQSIRENTRWVSHTYKVIREAERILAAAVDMETGMRGFLLSGKEEFLEPYKAGSEQFGILIKKLSNTVSDNPAQVTLLSEISTTITDWRSNVVQGMIDLRREIGDAETMDDMADLVGEARGKVYFDQFRNVAEAFKSEEKDLLIAREAEGKTTAESGLMLIFGAIGVSIFIGLILALLIGRSISKPIASITSSMGSMANGDLDADIPSQDRKDEIGLMASALSTFRDNLRRTRELESEQAETREREEKERAQTLENESNARTEVAQVVSAAVAGDFSQRLGTDGKTGGVLAMSEGVNSLLESVQRTLDEVSDVLRAMDSGDLGQRINGNYQGSFLELSNLLNSTSERLSTTIGNISSTVDVVESATSEISTGTNDLAQRTEQQASNLEETAAAMEELTATVRQNADSARQATTLSKSARESAESGGAIVNNAIDAMQRISGSSKKITEIVGMIEEIAFQTNLLALNAAVEAARAGDAGKGFAVVASEVRALAQRSSEASKEISGLIETSAEQVDDGVVLVNKTGETLEEIVGGVTKVADIITEISSASQEQAQGLDEVNSAVSNMDEMTQQNAALVEETTAAAQSLLDQAKELSEQVAFFQVAGRSTSPTPAKAKSAPIAPQSATARKQSQPSPQPAQVKSAAGDDDWQEF